MPRPRSPERDQSYAIYKQHNGEIENRRIADMVGKDERFIAKWKHEDAWVDKLKKNKGVHQTLPQKRLLMISLKILPGERRHNRHCKINRKQTTPVAVRL